MNQENPKEMPFVPRMKCLITTKTGIQVAGTILSCGKNVKLQLQDGSITWIISPFDNVISVQYEAEQETQPNNSQQHYQPQQYQQPRRESPIQRRTVPPRPSRPGSSRPVDDINRELGQAVRSNNPARVRDLVDERKRQAVAEARETFQKPVMGQGGQGYGINYRSPILEGLESSDEDDEVLIPRRKDVDDFPDFEE
jgi:hypothetical protein